MQSVYLDNTLGFHQGTDNNLEVITRQLDNGKRSLSTISAMLSGMGIRENDVRFAIKKYTREGQMKYGNQNSECPFAKMGGGFGLGNLVQVLKALKSKVSGLTVDENTINYTASNVVSVVENILSDIRVLEERLDVINEGDSDAKDVVIAKQQLHPAALKSKPEYYYANVSYNNLKGFGNIVAVKEYLECLNNVFENNFYTNYISNLIYEMESGKDSGYYADAIKDLSSLLKENEEYISESMNVVLNKHAWIPQIKGILEHNANKTKKLVSNKDVKVELLHSPVQVNEDGSYVFVMDGVYYRVNEENTLEKVEDRSEITPVFERMVSVLQNYKIEENKLNVYKPNSKLEIQMNEDHLLVNDIKVQKNDTNQIRNAIISTSFYRMDEMANVENILLVLENFGLIKEIDIVTRLHGLNGNIVNIVKLDENKVYINRVQPGTMINEMFETSNYKNAQRIVNEYVEFDITNSVYSILDRDSKVRANLNTELNEYKGRLKFLNNKLDEFKAKSAGIENEAINEAIGVLEGEIRKHEVDVQKVYNKLSELS